MLVGDTDIGYTQIDNYRHSHAHSHIHPQTRGPTAQENEKRLSASATLYCTGITVYKANAAGGFTVNGARFHYKRGESLKVSHT